ncbi:hypothetical protein CFIMG_005794RA [Ceratocystis fimbriata CBS 114723]|uniref:Uncharacterized protein n=1 Tax=Ceratocystis fimbriata CBS 114723 TaxID=1035309 RepID=A0A2C5WVE6_9PEZI|nr:hypothetical protein CFIMG_005794RA [Ceratocystis fimbriata CBS 114723]
MSAFDRIVEFVAIQCKSMTGASCFSEIPTRLDFPEFLVHASSLITIRKHQMEPAFDDAASQVVALFRLLRPQLFIVIVFILTWERGSKPTTTNIPHELPRLLLTIDARGLQEIKRLPGDLQLRRWRADDRVFVLTDQWKLAGVTAQFKFGLLRLTLPMTMYYGLDTWDTPTPPYLRQCQLHPSSIRPSTHFKTIDLRQITGITFFYSSNIIFAIHAHTEKAPCAQEALQRLHPSRRALATWVYIPIPQNDSVLALATPLALDKTLGTFNGCWLFRMRLAGDVLVGLTYSTRAARMVLSRSPPTTIVYSAVELEPTFVYGAYSMEMENEYLISAFKTPAITEPPFRNAFFSSASLENVDRVKIFSDESTGICRELHKADAHVLLPSVLVPSW